MNLVQALPEAIYLVDQGGRILFCNPALERLSGYAAETLRHRPDLILYLPEVAAALEKWRRRVRRGEEIPPLAEVQLVRKDGRQLPVTVVMAAIPVDGHIVVLHRVIACKPAELPVHNPPHVAPDAMLVVDATGHIVGANAQAEVLFGYCRRELFGRPVEELLHGCLSSMHEGHLVEDAPALYQHPMGMERKLCGHRKDGMEFPADISLVSLQTQGGALMVAVIRDATARQQTEAQLRAALQEKEVLLKQVFHRVKNDLQVVSNLLDLQADMVMDPQVRARLEESQRRIRTIALIHESLYQTGDVEHIDAADYFRFLSTQLFEVYGAPSHRLTLRFAIEDLWLDVSQAVPCGLILHELLSNAFKHAFPDGRTGEIGIRLWQEPPGTCVLTIQDDGIGIPAELDLHQINSLGLQLVSLLADQLGGTIALERSGGTIFRLSFPLVKTG